MELYDFGVTDDQTLYFVMELLEGLNLDSLVRRHGPLPPGRVVHILRQVCASLEEAHVRGLVHRDIKPANIHVGPLGLVYDFVKVLDFGLVKPATVRPNEDSLATQAGLVIGTPGYMAPENALSVTVDRQANLYSLGCVAYYLVTGRQVFEGETVMQVFLNTFRTPDATVAMGAIHGAARPRATRSGMPGEEPRGSARERRGARPEPLSGRCRTLDRRSRPAVVGRGEPSSADLDGNIETHRGGRAPGKSATRLAIDLREASSHRGSTGTAAPIRYGLPETSYGRPAPIGPVPPSSAKTPPGGRRRALPPDLLRDASRRLGIMSLVGCGLWTAGTALGHLAARSMSDGDQEWLRLGGPDAVAVRACSHPCCCSPTPGGVSGSPDRPGSRPGLHGVHGVRPRPHVPLGTTSGKPQHRAGH